MTITASMVKELRERTGAGMMECKKALQAANGDMEAAIDAMRKSGQLKAAKRAGKVTAEGRIVIATAADHKASFMVEVNCETDFVARDENFRSFTDSVAGRGLAEQVTDVAALGNAAFDGNGGVTINQACQELIVKIGENIQLRRATRITSDTFVGHYLHGDRIGVVVALDQANEDLARDLAMHIAATNPVALDESGVAPELLEKEREIYSAQAKESGKPDNIIEKMVTGRIAKYLKEICLLDQPFVKNPDQTIAQLLKEAGAKVQTFVRYEVGEGIEKEVVDFAEEVKAQVQGGE